MMKKIFQLSLIALLSFSMSTMFAQGRGPGRGEGMRRGGENRGFQGRFNRGFHQPPRAEAEKKLKERYPAEFAEIQKLRDEAEKKLQALAKKANVTLPAPPKSMSERMDELKKKYPKEMAEYESLMKTDRRAAFAKLRTIMQKEGFGNGRDGDRNAPSRMRNNPTRNLRAAAKKYPEDWKKIQETRRNDPAKAREMTKDLLQKYEKEGRK